MMMKFILFVVVIISLIGLIALMIQSKRLLKEVVDENNKRPKQPGPRILHPKLQDELEKKKMK